MRPALKEAFKRVGLLILIFFAIGGFIDFINTIRLEDPKAMRLYAESKTHEAWKKIPNTPTLKKTVKVAPMYVVIVGDQRMYRHKSMRESDDKILGYATYHHHRTTKKRYHYISLIGKEVNGKIYLNMNTLGHEFMHVLNNITEEVMNPHELEQEGL